MAVPRTLASALGTAAAVAVVGGCGGDDGSEQADRTVTVGAAETVEVVGGEYFFDPSTVVAGGGGPLELTLDNQGDLAHNLRVFEGEEDVGGTPTFAGGDSRTVSIELAPGSYRMVCTVADHEELGMVGELTLR